MRKYLLALALSAAFAGNVPAQTPPALGDFQAALNKANAATQTNDLAGTLPGYGGTASDLQAKSGEDVASLQGEGGAAAATNPMTGTISNANSFVAANPVNANAAWVKGALGVANDPGATAGGSVGVTSMQCRTAGAATTETTLYTCNSGNQVTVATSTCQTYRDITNAPAMKTCQTDSYYESQATFANISDYTEAHDCTLYSNQGGLDRSRGCGFLIDKIPTDCAPPKQVSGSHYIEYCKTAYTSVSDVGYLGHRTNSCAPISADTACTLSSETCDSWFDTTSGICSHATVTYSCSDGGYRDNGLNTAACDPYAGNPACTATAQACVEHASDRPEIMAALGLAPDTCLKTDLTYACDSVSGTTSDCEAPAGCTLKSRTCIDPNYDGSSPCQTYDYAYACRTTTDQANAGQAMCDASWVNGTAIITASDDPQNDLPQALSALNALKGASDSFGTSGGLTIFTGEGLKCRKSIGGLSNCCKDSGVLNDLNLTRCHADETKLATEQSQKACHYIGTYCSNKSLFGCLEKKMTYCCYGSVLARIVEEAGHDQLGKSWGDAKSPQCGGFSIAEFQGIDLTNVDFSDFYSEKLGQLADNDPNSTVAAITASINSMNSAQRAVK